MDPFQQRKQQTIADLDDASADKSRKGSVDRRIIGLVTAINQHHDVFTTSSCSGRITVFAEPTAETRASGKKGGEWVYATHDTAEDTTVIARVKERMCSGARLVFRFEPFILAAECRSVDVGRHMLAVARQSGFRESGLHIAERVILSVRCSLRLEAPVADGGRLLVTDEYIQYLVKLANEKMLTNWQRVERLDALLADKLQQPFPPLSKGEGAQAKGSSKKKRRSPDGMAPGVGHVEGGEGSAYKSKKKSKLKSRPARKAAIPLQTAVVGEGVEAGPAAGPEAVLKAKQEQLLWRLKEVEGKLAQAAAGRKSSPAWTQSAATIQSEVDGVPLGGPSCWGHSACLVGSTIVVFGGYGGTGQHTRTNDVALYDTQLGVWKNLDIKGDVRPKPRTGHCAVAVGQKLLVIGGRTHPKNPLDDVYLLDLATCCWTQLNCVSSAGSPTWQGRFRHSAVAVGGDLESLRVFVFGGKGPDGVLSNDVWVLQQIQASGANTVSNKNEDVSHPNSSSGSSPPPGGPAVWTWTRLTCTGDIPSPRKSHTACLVTQAGIPHMLVQGGIGPAYGFYYNSLYSLNLHTLQWALHMGSAASVQDSRPQWDSIPPPNTNLFSDATAAPIQAAQHTPAASSAYPPSGAHHQTNISGINPDANPSCNISDVSNSFTQVPCEAGPVRLVVCSDVPACFSHSLTAIPDTDLLLRYGGCPADAQQSMHVIDWKKKLCWKVLLPFPRDLVPMRHAAIVTGNTLYSIGGGAFCFSFGSVFSSNFSLDISFLLTSLPSSVPRPTIDPSTPVPQEVDSQLHMQDLQHNPEQTTPNVGPAEVSMMSAMGSGVHGGHTETTSSSAGNSQRGAHVNETLASTGGSQRGIDVNGTLGSRGSHVKTDAVDATLDALQAHGLTAPQRSAGGNLISRVPASDRAQQTEDSTAEDSGMSDRVHRGSCTEGRTFVLKVNKKSAKAAKDALKAQGWLERSIKTAALPTDPGTVSLPLIPAAVHQLQAVNPSLPVELQLVLQAGAQVVQVVHGAATPNLKYQAAQSPATRLQLAVAQFLTDKVHFPEEVVQKLCKELPTKWEKLGDLVLIPANSMKSAEWQECGAELWRIVGTALQAKRIARQAPVANTGTRDSRAQLLLGDSGWVTHRESGVTFTLDVTRCMYSSGNVTERTRIGNMRCEGETVLDLYTGIGYYTLPILVKGGAEKVFACEWNPHAVEALKKNLEVNGVSARCEVLVGDCRQVAPKGPMFDRVLLGLLPSSKGGWPTAVAALKDTGGWLHIHENVLDSEESQFVADTVEQLQQIATDQGRNFLFRVNHVERVKWYAPHIRHIVMDVEVTGVDSNQAARGEEMLVSATQNPTAHPMPNVERADSVEAGQRDAAVKVEGGKQAPSSPPEAMQATAGTDSIKQWATSVLEDISSSAGIPLLDAQHLTPQQFHDIISPLRIPVILKGLDLGPAPAKWTPDYLMSVPKAKEVLVSCHVCREESGAMDFTNKNFVFKIMTLEEMVGRAAKAGGWADAEPLVQGEHPERYYLRSLGENPRKEPSDISKAFPELAKDLRFPDFVPPGSEFSTVLRISSQTLRLWTHYDVMDNFLMQVTGEKEVWMWPPSDEDNLYVSGSSSPIIHVDKPDLLRFPKYQNARARRCTLRAGDVLFIPSLWFHNVLSHSFSVSVNVFWRHLPQSFYERKDLYGNRDLVPYNIASNLAAKINQTLAALPGHYLEFYKQRILKQIEECVSAST